VRGGYDGRGVWMLDGAPTELPGVAVYVEQRVPLIHELAVQVARRPSGELRTWPVVETVQADGICVETVAPAPRTSPAPAIDGVPEAHVHLYGKSARPGRKLGHVTVLGDDVVEARARARLAVSLLRGED